MSSIYLILGALVLFLLATAYLFYKAGMQEMQMRVWQARNLEIPLYLRLIESRPVYVFTEEEFHRLAVYKHRCQKQDSQRREGVV